MSRGIYHIEDPLENFKIRIRVRETYRPPHARDNIDAPLFEDDIVISWQEKLYGPTDVLDFVTHKGSTRGRPSQLDSRRHLAQVEKAGKEATSILSETMIYTYVNDEPFYPEKSPLLNTDVGKETYLSYANDPISETSKSDDRLMKVVKRVQRERQYSTMYICLAANVDKDAIKKHSFWSSNEHFSEFVLLSIHLSKSGVLVASPPFSPIVPEGNTSQQVFTAGDHTSGSHPTAPTVYLDDNTVLAGLQKGFQLGTYRVCTAKGSEYEYTIENVNGVISPIEMEDMLAAEHREDVVAGEQSRGYHRGEAAEKWHQDPPPESFTSLSTVYAEIVSASGFGDGDAVYVKYQAALPKNWAIRKKQRPGSGSKGLSEGTESKERKNELSEKATLLHGHGNSSHTSAVDDQDMVLHGFTQLSSASCSRHQRRTQLVHAEKGMELKCYSVDIPAVPLQFMAENSFGRYLIGWLFLSVTALSVLMGFERPLWLVPALVFIFVLGSGTPGSPPQVVVCSDELAIGGMDGDGKGVAIVGDCVAEPVAAFGHVFTADVIVKSNEDTNIGGAQARAHHQFVAPSADKMTLFFEVYSVSLYGRHTLEGCGYTSIPNTAGDCDQEISTWKPVGDYNSTLMDFFVGGGAHLSSVRFMEIPNKSATGLSKFGSRTESAGTIRFKYRTVQYTPSKARILDESGSVPTATHPGRRTVEDILSSYRNVDLLNKSLSKKSLRGVLTPVSKSARSVLGKEDSDPTAPLSVDKVADIIARARASASASLSSTGGVKKIGSTSASGSVGGIAMMHKHGGAPGPEAPDVASQSSGNGYSLLDGGIDDDFVPSAGGEGSSLVDRLEASGIMQHDHPRRNKLEPALGGSEDRVAPRSRLDEASIASPLHSVSNTPARGRKDRYNSGDSDNE